MTFLRAMAPFSKQERFYDRAEAGRALARQLIHYADDPDVVVLALPRGGVPVGYEVAQRLGAPLDVMVVRKLGAPGHEEFALGAIASGGVMVLDQEKLNGLGVTQQQIDGIIQVETDELHRREASFRGSRPPVQVQNKTVILVDDGLATGATMQAAAQAIALQMPSRTVVAVPVAAAETCQKFQALVDEVVCVLTPEPFYAVGMWYRNFEQLSDEEVHDILEKAWHNHTGHYDFRELG